jgi:hypothetical protein
LCLRTKADRRRDVVEQLDAKGSAHGLIICVMLDVVKLRIPTNHTVGMLRWDHGLRAILFKN